MYLLLIYLEADMKKTLKGLLALAVALLITICGSAMLADDQRPKNMIDKWSDGEPHLRHV